MSDEAAKNAPLGAACDEDVEEIRKALDYWHKLDFLSQGNLPDESNVKKDEKIPVYKNHTDRFVSGAAQTGQEADRTLISLVEERLDEIVKPEDRKKISSKEVFVHLGRIPREMPVAYLIRHDEDKRIERETGDMAAAILGLTPDGAFSKFELSPLLWLTDEDYTKLDIANYDERNEQITERLSKYSSPLTVSDVRQIVQSEIIDPYLRPIDNYQRQLEEASDAGEGKPSGKGKRKVLGTGIDIEQSAYALLFDYQVHTKDKGDYTVSFKGFYTEDIKALSQCAGAVKSLDALHEGQLALVAQYLEAGLRGQAARRREERRKSVLPADASDTEDCLEVYREKMGYGAMPLGRWPSRYSLSFMQQLGVNLVAPGFAALDADKGGWQGNRDEHDGLCARDDAPQRIWSVNGPPGTGKTTLLKDVVAANIVEKARLLCRYDDPDDAFENEPIVFPERKSSYIKDCDGVFRLRDGEVANLGIVVCSSNNAAVENISKELPKAADLLAGVDVDERKSFLDEGEKKSDLNGGDSLAKVKWSPRGKDKDEPRKTRDLYFSFPAYNQFREWDDRVVLKGYNDKDDDNLDLLLAARLGRKSNIDDFLHGSLKTLYWNAPRWGGHKSSSGGRESQLHRYRRAQKEFQAQYEKVKRELDVFAEYGRLVKELEKAENDYRQAQAESDAKARKYQSSREGDLGTLRDIARTCGLDVREAALDSPDELESLYDELMVRAKKYEADKALYEGMLDIAEESLGKAEDAREAAEGAFFLVRARRAQEANDAIDRAKGEVKKAEHNLKVFEADNRKRACCSQGAEDLRHVLDGWYESKDECADARARSVNLANMADEFKKDCDHKGLETKVQRARLAGPNPQFLRDDDGDLRDGGFDYDGFVSALASEDDGKRKQAHLFNPISNPDILRERDLLFIKTLRLTREFILASRCMESNLRYLMAYWGAADTHADSGKSEAIKLSDPDAKAVAPALFQSLSVLTPVISTTFASAQRLFKDIPITRQCGDAPLGLLVIDEAGQALPYAALGVLARCRRAMVVGDPFQIEPVVAQEAKVLRPILAEEIAPAYKQDCASVQRLADAANPYGQWREDEDGDSTWVGCPLVVHRRCVSPMFDISNKIAYQNAMLNETRMLDFDEPQDKQKLERFYMPSSQWLNVVGGERGKKDHYVETQGKRVVEIVMHAFMKKPDGPSLFVISPFTTVIGGIKRALGGNKPAGVSEDAWDDFLKNNIGTVHTFQGKEADEVVFALGCDKDAPGAVQFVGVNIVNVAASRAKHRLYVVGDYNVWKCNEHVAAMKRILDTAWVKHWKAYVETGDPAELLLASQMRPTLESLSFVDDDLDLTTVEEWIRSNPEYDPPSLDTGSYIENLGALLGGLGLEDYYRFYGFELAEELENLLFDPIDMPEADRELILNNLKCAKLYYDVSCAVASAGLPEEFIKPDFSGCLVYLARAVEIYLGVYELPLLKKNLADPTKKGKAKSPSVGQYASYLRKYEKRLIERTSRGVGDDETNSAGRGTSEQWWADLAKSIEEFAKKRNLSCHPEKRKEITAEVIDEARDLLCKGSLTGKEACEVSASGEGDAPTEAAATSTPARKPLAMSEGDVFAAAIRGMEGEPELPCDCGEDEGAIAAAACGAEGESELPSDCGEGAQATTAGAQVGAPEPAEGPTDCSSGEASAEVPPEAEMGVVTSGACEPAADSLARPDDSPAFSPEPDEASLPATEEAPKSPGDQQTCETSEAPFFLGDARSEDDDGCLAFTRINEGGRCAALLGKLPPEEKVRPVTLVLNWLGSRGYIETRSFEQVEGKYPTAQGYALGIRWRLYPNSKKENGLAAGVVFNEAAQKWLVEEAPALVDDPGESTGC